MLNRTALSLLVIIGGLLPIQLMAQPAPKIDAPPREYFQRGTYTELTLSGENLGEAKEIKVSGAAGIVATVVSPGSAPVGVESSAAGISAVSQSDVKKLSISISVSTNASLTERELRVVTPFGVSNPISVRVSDLPEVNSGSENTSLANAQMIEMPATVNGVIANAAESDFFKIKANQNEHIILDVYAFRLGSPLDSSLAVLDNAGKELARNEDAAGLDSILDFKAPESGEYIVQLRDFRYQGGGNYKYRLRAGVLPHVTSTYPYGGRRGENVEVELTGVNLDGASKIILNLASDAALGKQEIRTTATRGVSNPFPFDVSDLPQFYEKEPNTAIDQADAVVIPVAINGKIGKEKDYDAFKFHAEKDQQIIFEVFAFRYGSKLDALLTLTDEHGNILQRNDDAASEDARLDHRFSEEGDYVILIEDLLGRGGDEYGYRMTATTPQPDFSAVFLADVSRVHRDGRVPVRCEVNRVNGFNAPVIFKAENLPTGIYAEPLLVPADATSGLLLLNASAEAALGSFPLKVMATAVMSGNRGHEAQPIAGEKAARGGFLTVLEAAPFSIETATLMAGIEQNQSGTIEVVVNRKQGFNGEIKITPEGFSIGRDPIGKSFDFQPLTIKAGENHGSLSLKTKLDSEIATRTVVCRGESEVGGQLMATYSSAIPIGTTSVPFVLSTSLKKLVVTAIPSGSSSAAAEGVFLAKAERRDGFEGEIELKLEGVPEGVTATVVNIPAKANEIPVKLVASEKGPVGKDFQLTLTGTGTHKDRIYRFKPAAVTLTINAPEPAENKDPKLANAEK